MIVLAGNFFLRLAIVFLIAIFTLTHGLLYAQTVSDSLEPVSLIPNKILENTDVDKVSDKNITNKSEIEIGIRDSGYVEVISGLKEGDIIVAEGLKKVRPRGKIKPINN